MSELTPEKVKQVVDFILKYGNHPEVSNLLGQKGYKLVPNKLSILIENLRKAGYSVEKIDKNKDLNKEATNEKIKEDKEVVNSKTTEDTTSKTILLELFGGRQQVLDTQTDTNNLNKLEELKDSLETNNTIDPSTNEEEIVQEKEENQNLIETNISIQEDTPWNQVLHKAKEKSIAFFSLIVNAKVVELNENNITLGFNQNNTYQMNQLKREDKLNIFKEIIKEVFNKDLSINTIITSIEPITADSEKQNDSNYLEFQISGGRKI